LPELNQQKQLAITAKKFKDAGEISAVTMIARALVTLVRRCEPMLLLYRTTLPLPLLLLLPLPLRVCMRYPSALPATLARTVPVDFRPGIPMQTTRVLCGFSRARFLRQCCSLHVAIWRSTRRRCAYCRDQNADGNQGGGRCRGDAAPRGGMCVCVCVCARSVVPQCVCDVCWTAVTNKA
jgi:hypothetical protein